MPTKFYNEVPDTERSKLIGFDLTNAGIALSRAHSDLLIMRLKHESGDKHLAAEIQNMQNNVNSITASIKSLRSYILAKFCTCHEGSVCTEACDHHHHEGCNNY